MKKGVNSIKKNVVQTEMISRRVYFIVCPICEKKIRGTDTESLNFNFRLHKDKHKRRGEKVKQSKVKK